MQKIGFSDIKKVFVTLPIGYYAFGRVPAILEQHGNHTYYDPRTNTIHVDGEQVEKFCGNLPDGEPTEPIIRALLYHELSHAMLTPKYPKVPYILNVMEDERIETVLKDYYEGVDFKRNLAVANNWDGTCDEVCTKPTQAFYDIVRYHIAPPNKNGKRASKLVTQAEDIVDTFKDMNANETADGWYGKHYIRAIRALYEEVKKWYPEEEDEQEQDGEGEAQSGDSQKNGAQAGEAIGDKDEDYEASGEGEGNGGQQKTGTVGDTATNGGGESSNMMGGMRPTKINPRLDRALNAVVHEMQSVKPEPDTKLMAELDRIFTSFNKKNSGGSSMNCYSGVLNPRNCGRADYRFWEKKAPINGGNKYGTVHLNLFVDVSGSMYDSIRMVNQLIDSLHEVTRKHKEVTFSIMAMGEGQRRIDIQKEPYLSAGGGNDLTEDIINQYRDMQKKNTAVYNLVVFDGLAYSYGCEKNFAAFNHGNCTIFSDRDNKSAIEQYAPQAKHIFTQNYATDFIRGVLKTLEVAFH